MKYIKPFKTILESSSSDDSLNLKHNITRDDLDYIFSDIIDMGDDASMECYFNWTTSNNPEGNEITTPSLIPSDQFRERIRIDVSIHEKRGEWSSIDSQEYKDMRNIIKMIYDCMSHLKSRYEDEYFIFFKYNDSVFKDFSISLISKNLQFIKRSDDSKLMLTIYLKGNSETPFKLILNKGGNKVYISSVGSFILKKYKDVLEKSVKKLSDGRANVNWNHNITELDNRSYLSDNGHFDSIKKEMDFDPYDDKIYGVIEL